MARIEQTQTISQLLGFRKVFNSIADGDEVSIAVFVSSLLRNEMEKQFMQLVICIFIYGGDVSIAISVTLS